MKYNLSILAVYASSVLAAAGLIYAVEALGC